MEDSPVEIAKAYEEALDTQAADDEYEAALERLNGLKERLERFKENYGDSDPATQELKEKIETAKKNVNELERERSKPEEFEHELLEAAKGFMLDDEWLRSEVIEMLNRALTGSRYPTLRVDDIELSGPEDAKELDEFTRYDMIDIIRKLALDKLGKTDDLEEAWRSIEGTTKEEPFMVVVDTGGADPDDLMEAVDEDIERSVARNRLKSAVYQLDINPYHREDGTYFLSTAGRYLATEYVDNGPPDEEMSADIDSDVAPGKDGQTKLVEEIPSAEEGEDNE